MILDSPGTSPSVIAHAHGFSAVEVAELLPIFLDNLRTDFSAAAGPAPALVPPTQRPGESAEEHADRYLRELAQNEHLDVVGYHTLGPADGELDGELDDDLDADPSFLDGAPEETPPVELVELGTDPVDQPGPRPLDADPAGDLSGGDLTDGDLSDGDLTADDPFAASVQVLPGAPDVGAPVDDTLDDPAGDAGDFGGPHAVG
jgi:hypothetical protein